jgi:hypothetical protein
LGRLRVAPEDKVLRSTSGAKGGSRIATRLAKVTALIVGCVALLYFVGMNAFLQTRLFRDAIGSDPDMILVEYTNAYSLWPGRIHADGLSIRGRDSHVEWILRLAHCDVRVSFTDLAHKKFHASRVRADGVSMRVRLRADAFTPETTAALPPVPGFADPPLKDVGPPPPPLTDATYNLWTIELDDVVATHIDEVWIDTMRTTGDLDVRGRWLFHPMRSLDMGPAIVDVRSVEVAYGTTEPWTTGLAGRLTATIYPVDLQKVEGADMVDQVSIAGDLSGTALLANAVNRVTKKKVNVAIAEAPFELHAEVDHGILRPGTHLRVDPFDAKAGSAGLVFEASLQADLHVDDENVGYADVRVATARVSAGGQPRAWATSVATTLSSRRLDLADAFSDANYALDVEGARTDSLAYWRSRLAPTSEVELPSGTVTLHGHLAGALAHKTAKGHLAFEARSLVAAVAQAEAGLEGDVDGNVEIAQLDLEQRQVTGAVQLTAERLIARLKGMSLRTDLKAHTEVREGRWDPVRFDFAGSDVSLRNASATIRGARFVVPSLDARSPALAIGPAGLAGRVSLDAPRVELPSLPALGALVTLPEDVAIEGGAASASLRLDVDLARLAGNGGAQIAAHGVRIRIGAQTMAGELTVGLRATQSGDVTDLSGSHVEYKSAGAPETLDWWGRAQLRDASVRIHPEVRFRTRLSAEAKDASPVTALVASNTAIPQWLMNAVSTKQFEVTGGILMTSSVFAVRSLQAHAQGADVGFELSKIRANKDWALLLDIGAVVAGVDVANGKTQLLLFGARPWFQQKAAWLQAVEQRNE